MKITKNINKDIFRAYDIRGFNDKDLNEDVFYTLGRAYATFLDRRRIKESAVGRDNRVTSEKYCNAFIKGMNDGGIDIYNLGLSLSPIVYYSSYEFKTRAGAMVSASHNPKDMNGVKLSVGYSETMISSEIQQIRQIIESGAYSSGKGVTSDYDVFPSYKKDILKYFKFTRKWKVFIDAGNNTSGRFYPDIFRSAGCEVIESNTSLDGEYPLGVPDPMEKRFLERISKGVVENSADIGFGYDADGDRMGVVDEKGNFVWMDAITCIFAKDVLDFMPNSPIVFNTLCSRQVPETIKEYGGEPVMWITGHSFIRERILKLRAPFGGELSGHMFFNDNFYGHDDAVYASLRLLQYLERVGKTLGQAVSELPKYISSPEIKFAVADGVKFGFISKKVRKDFLEAWPEGKYTDIDGVRVDLDDSMVIARASQNGPYVTVRFESKRLEEYDRIKAALSKMFGGYAEINLPKGIGIEDMFL